MPMEIDRRAFISSLGGVAVVSRMSHEARADALEDYSILELDRQVAYAQAGQNAAAPEHFPTPAQSWLGKGARFGRLPAEVCHEALSIPLLPELPEGRRARA